jgi:hypothetical protein
LIGHADPRHVATALEQLAEEALGRGLVAVRGDQDIEDLAVLIDRSP